LGELDRKIASEQGQVFGTIHDPMMKAMAAAKATLGANVPVCGGDGVHPGPNGSLVMAYAFLKAMGFDGNLGTITVDMTGQAEATDGHKVLSAKDGTVELESTRYPFCFPANQDLNQLTLVVKNLKADNATVTWGKASKTFSKDQLTKGVNLAAEFLDNPFAETWAKVDGAVAAKENFETAITHNYTRALAGWAALLGDDPEAAAAIKVLQGKLMTRHEPLREAVGKARVPVKHTLVISAK
jgi:hypothetical protein